MFAGNRCAIINEGGAAGWVRLVALRLVFAGFTALETVVLAVFAQTDLVGTLAQGAVLVAIASFFYLLANHAAESFGHERRVTRNVETGKSEVGPFVPW